VVSGLGFSKKRSLATSAQDSGPRLQHQIRLVPVVDPAEEDERALRREAQQAPPHRAVSRGGFGGNAEGNDREEIREGRIRRKVGRSNPPRGVERSAVEEALLRRRAEEEIGARERERERRTVVGGGRRAERRGVVKVLDEEGIVEVRGDGDVGDLVEPPVGRVPRDDRGVGVDRGGREAAGGRRHDRHVAGGRSRLRRVVAHEEPDVELRPQRPGELQSADSHPGHLRPDRFRGQDDDAARH
jgi:hypothetical protein